MTKTAIEVQVQGTETSNLPASKQLTWSLYLANVSASKIDPIKYPIHNGKNGTTRWDEQGLTTGEALAKRAEYNVVSGYVTKVKTANKVVGAKIAKKAPKTMANVQANVLKLLSDPNTLAALQALGLIPKA